HRGQAVAVLLQLVVCGVAARPDTQGEAPARQGVVDGVFGLGRAQVQNLPVCVDRGELAGQGQQLCALGDRQAILRGLNVVGDQEVRTAALEVRGDTDTRHRGGLVDPFQAVVYVELVGRCA